MLLLQGLTNARGECVEAREEEQDACVSTCFDDHTRATAHDDETPSGSVDVVLPLALSSVPYANVTATTRGDIFLR